jgi:hypothetical protein
LLLAGGTIWAQQYLITTVAGGTVTPTPASAVSVGLVRPVAAAVDPAGNLYFSDGNCVFKVDHSGILTRVAGTGIAGYSGDNGPATAAQLKLPSGVAVDASGSVYIADAGNSRVRKVTPDGTITTLAGDGTYGYSGDGGPATAAQLQWPTGVGVDAAGDVYIADSDANALRRVTPGGAITTVAVGSGWSVAVDAAGNAYTAVPSGNVVFRIAPDGKTTVVAGVYEAGYSGDGGPATSAQLNNPWGVALDAAGSIYIADAGNHRVRKVAVDGTISTIAGDGTSGSSGDVGPALSARFDPQSVAVDAAGNVYIVDMDNVRLRRVAADGTITTAAGGGNGDSGDGGPATNARLSNPWGLALDGAGNLYIADSYNNRVRKVAADGTIVTVAGNGTAGNSGDGGPAANAQLGIPKGVALDSAGNLYIADLDNSRIRKVGVDGNIATLAAFDHPDSVAVDVGGNLYVADTSSCTVRKVAAGGTISTLVGNTDPKYSAMGGSASTCPNAATVDAAGNLYFADGGAYWEFLASGSHINRVVMNSEIRKMTPDGAITTVAGAGFAGYSGDGTPATEALLDYPNAIALDAVGNLFIADGNRDLTDRLQVQGSSTGNNVVRKVAASGIISTVAGNRAAGWVGDGGTAVDAELNGPGGLVAGANGRIYIADADNNAIRLLVPVGTSALLTATSTHSGYFAPGQAGATFTVTVSNAEGAGPTAGAVTVKESVSLGLTLASLSGPGWNCANGSCTRGDALAGGSSYPPITVTVNVAADAPSQVTNQVAVAGGGAPGTSATDLAVVLAPPQTPVLISPANGATGLLTAPVLSWGASFGAVSYDVYFGASSAPALVANTAGLNYAPGTLAVDTTYYWRVVAQSGSGSASSATGSFRTAAVAGLRFVPVTPCRLADTRGPVGPFGGPTLAAGLVRSFAIPQSACGIPVTAQAYSLNVTAVPKGSLGYLSLWPAGQVQPVVSTLNSFSGDVVANAAVVPAGSDGAVSVFVTGLTDVILDINGYFDTAGGAGSFAFYAATPCRVADTRNPAGAFGGPQVAGNDHRDFAVPASGCGIPAGAGAFSLNVTAVPDRAVDYLGFLTAWPAGQQRPVVSTLNSWTGKVVANAAIVPAGSNGSVSVYVTDPTDVVVDTNGYFAAPGGTGALTFYPVTPCRVADTRNAMGPFGGPTMGPGEARSFTVPVSACPVPAAAAYSLNITVVPAGRLSYLTTWPTGSAQPLVSTLNSFDGSIVANAAIVPAGPGGAVSVFVTNQTDVILDINGYFAP